MGGPTPPGPAAVKLTPPFDQLPPPRGRAPGGPSRQVTVELPADLAAWLDDRTGGDPALRANLAALALDALRRYDEGRGWPDVPAERLTPERRAAILAELAAPADPDAEPDGFDEWLEEREAERNRLTERAEAVDAAQAPYDKSAEEVLAWIHALPDDLPGETPMEEIVRDIYRRRGYPMDDFKFGPDPDTTPADAARRAA